jgi:hypothetical protein
MFALLGPVLPGTTSSFEMASVPEESVSMSAALKGAKNFRVTTSLGGMFNAGDVLFCTAAFFEVSSEARLLNSSQSQSYEGRIESDKQQFFFIK